MCVIHIIVRHSREHGGIRLILHVNDSERILVTETDLPPPVLLVRSVIHHALCVVHVAVLSEAACEFRVLGIVHVDHVQTASAGASSHGVHESCFLVPHDVVGAGHFVVVCVGLYIIHTSVGRGREVAETGEVENLHAVVGGLAHNVGVVFEYLDVGRGKRTLVLFYVFT